MKESSLMEVIEEEKSESKKKDILEDLIKTVPYNLSVALIKITQLNNYAPLTLEKYYANILPTFDLLRRTDGSKYKSQSITTVRSAMVSNKLYTKNSEGLYEINLNNAIKHLKMIKQKKSVNENDFDSSFLENNNDDINDKMEINNFDDDFNILNNYESIPKTKKKEKDFLGKKQKKLLKIKPRSSLRTKIEKFVKTF